MTKEDALTMLKSADVFYYEDDEDPQAEQTLNMNDTWGWGLAWGEYVSDDELPEVGRLFFKYGFCGLLYWMSRKHDNMRSEFFHYNRMLEFVENEEKLRSKYPSSSQLAYAKASYRVVGDRKNKKPFWKRWLNKP
jgi:hypothetical protein